MLYQKFKNKKILTASLTAIGILFLGIFFIQFVNANKICQGAHIAGINVGGKTPAEAQKIFEEKWALFSAQPVEFIYQQPNNPQKITCCENASTTLADFGFEIDYQKTIDQAYQIDKEASYPANLKNQISALLGKYHFKVIYTFNEEQFQATTKKVFENIEQPARDATLVFDKDNKTFILQPSADGTIINRQQLLLNLTNNIKNLANAPVNLQIDFDPPKVREDKVDFALQKAQQILSAQPFQVYYENNVWTIKQEVLANWLKFEPTAEINSKEQTLSVILDKNKIKEYLSSIAKTIDQPTLDAKLEIKDNRAVTFVPPQEGFGLHPQESLELLSANILADPPVTKTKLVVGKTAPRVELSQTNELGINTLIGQGISNFAGSPKNRIHNIKTGVEKFKGVILAPNEEFSFLNLLGGSGPEQGFLEELVIKKGELVNEFGGGLCQVSTTFFRAAVNSGLKITKRKPHAFPVSYYNPQGFDATVYEPYTDFRFINNTPDHLLIDPVINGTKLTFNFYGTNDGRVVKIIGPTVLEKKEDGSLKTVLTQEIYNHDELISSDSFYSNYDSPNKYKKEEVKSE